MKKAQGFDCYDRPLKPADAGVGSLPLFAEPGEERGAREVPVLLIETPDDAGHVATVDPAVYPEMVE